MKGLASVSLKNQIVRKNPFSSRLYIVPTLLMLSSLSACAQEINQVLPVPKLDETSNSQRAEIVFSGGCFWGVQGVFQHVKGVQSAVSGYTGGSAATAQYPAVSTGTTGHAESVKVVYNPQQIRLGELLRIYFSVAHDPTELNKQGPDTGTQYRSAVWTTTAEQQRVVNGYITQLNKTGIFDQKIVTQVQPLNKFYAAEQYHQNYLTLHPNEPYIAINDLPKIKNLQRLYPADYRATPILVGKN